jgi:hypothetical protein
MLDVDGVINDLRWSSPFSIASHGFRLHIPDYMPKLIQAIHGRAEVRWLTTWREWANDDIAPFLGIPSLEAITDGTEERHVGWKPMAALPHVLEALEAGRKVYWIEDHEFDDYGGIWERVEMITTLPYYVLKPDMVPEELGGWK